LNAASARSRGLQRPRSAMRPDHTVMGLLGELTQVDPSLRRQMLHAITANLPPHSVVMYDVAPLG